MQILSVALQNFKTHRDRYFEFQPGTNAICGENGAGKTSILEAIAWVLFNYQGDYAKEDLIRNGSGSAQVTVAFTSNYDGRTYQAQRCTQRGYTLYDPQLNQRLPYTRLKDEVLPWLRQHLGVGPTTNLPQLFARTLGVPQGTFTADFLQPAEQRKAVFDAILKVEDYKQAFKQMNTLRRYAEDRVEATKGQIAQFEESLQGWDELHQRQQTLQRALTEDEEKLVQLEAQLAQIQQQRAEVQAHSQRVQALDQQRQELAQRLVAQQETVERLRQLVDQAATAIALCQTHRAAYEGYQAADRALQALAQEQQQRQRWQQEWQALSQRQAQHQVELTRWQTQLENLAATEQELAQLQPQIEAQTALETQRQTLKQQIEDYRQQQQRQQQAETQRADLAQRQAQAQAQRDRLLTLQPQVVAIAELEDQRHRLQQQLSRIAAACQFEGEIRALVATSQGQGKLQRATVAAVLEEVAAMAGDLPLPSAPLDQLRQAIEGAIEGAMELHGSLLAALESILSDLADQTDERSLQATLKALEKDLKQRYGWQGELGQLAQVEQQLDQLQRQQAAVTGELEAIAQQLAHQPQVAEALAHLDRQLEALGHPREKSQILARTLPDRARLEAGCQSESQALAAVGDQMDALTAQLATLADLDQRLDQTQSDRSQYQGGHSLYLQNQQLANQHPQLQGELAVAEADLAQGQAQQAAAAATYREAIAGFDPAAAAALEASYSTLKSAADQLAGSLPQQRQRLADLAQQIATLEGLAQRRDAAQQTLRHQEKAKRFITFARKAYNEAGPRITEQYVHSISQQADRLFRELLNRPNVALQWTRDYEIVVQDGPNPRRFINLSGGEQMCAALAVRLALLKVLADADIAFFDEPTTNMDQARRRGLAEAIGRIKSFQQLFVISHDDTFEQVTEHVIVVERESA